MRRAAAQTATVFFVDTSCIVACVCSWHVHHAQATAQIEQRLDAGEKMATAAHAAAEAYAVLTRLPAPYRLSPADALALIEGNFLDGAVALDAGGYRKLLRQAGADGISGGRTYDAIIAACALRAKAATLLTFNARHFAHLESAGIRVVVPGTET
jgi:predicted nucleic acid-binding protein